MDRSETIMPPTIAATLNVGVIAKNKRNVKNKLKRVVEIAAKDCKRKNIASKSETITIPINVAFKVAEKANLASFPLKEISCS